MKNLAIMTLLLAVIVPCSFAEKPRTVGVYKRHMNSEDHRNNDFDHSLHHMLYLSGVGDGYATVNKLRQARSEPLLFCRPEEKKLSGADYMQILEEKLSHPVEPAADTLSVAEALLQALQEEFPCQ